MPIVPINHTDIYIEEHGSGEPLFLLHGFGSSTRDWEAQLPDLADRFRVVLVDFRGFGQSNRKTGPFSVEQFASDIFAVADHLQIERFHLLGYSMGGAAAQQMAVDCPERIQRLILVNTVPSFRPDHWRKVLELYMRRLVVRLLGMEKMAGVIAKKLFPREDQEALREVVRERYSDNSTAVYMAVLKTLPRWSVREKLSTIASPTLVIAAEHDYTPVAEKEAMVQEIADSRLEVIRESRHGTPFDQTVIFNALVREFLLTRD